MSSKKQMAKKSNNVEIPSEYAPQLLRAVLRDHKPANVAKKLGISEHDARKYMEAIIHIYDPAKRGAFVLTEILMSMAERCHMRDLLAEWLNTTVAEGEIEPRDYGRLMLDIQKVAQKDDEIKFKTMFESGRLSSMMDSVQFGHNVRAMKWLVETMISIVHANTTPEQRMAIREAMREEFKKAGWSHILEEQAPTSTTVEDANEMVNNLQRTLQNV